MPRKFKRFRDISSFIVKPFITRCCVHDSDVKTGMSCGHSALADDILLQEDLVELMPMVLEANAISEELNKKMFFEIALVSPQARGLKDGRTEVSLM